MNEEGNKVIEDPLTVETEPVSMMSQLGSLVILLCVLGVIWMLFKYLPSVGDWVGEKTDEVFDSEVERAEDEKPVEVIPEASVAMVPVIPAQASSPASSDLSGYQSQIEAQLAGSGNVEVRHLALSEDGKRMVAALQLSNEDGAEELVEVFFDRDEFGRYLSNQDSPVGTPLKLWGK